MVVVASVATVPPPSSVLPPGAGNEAEKASKTKPERAKKLKHGYICLGRISDRQVNAPALRRDDDGDEAARPTSDQAHMISKKSTMPVSDTFRQGSLAGCVNAARRRGSSAAPTRVRHI